MNRVPLRFMHEFVGQLHPRKPFFALMLKLLNAAERLSISQSCLLKCLVELLDRLQFRVSKRLAKFIERGRRFLKAVMHRVDAPRRVLRPRCISVGRPAAYAVITFAGNDLQPDLQRMTAVVGEDQRRIEMEVLQKKRLMTKLLAGHGPS